jgi:hypothetical protein
MAEDHCVRSFTDGVALPIIMLMAQQSHPAPRQLQQDSGARNRHHEQQQGKRTDLDRQDARLQHL